MDTDNLGQVAVLVPFLPRVPKTRNMILEPYHKRRYVGKPGSDAHELGKK